MLNTDKCFPNIFGLLVKSVDIELWVEGLMEIHLGEDLGNSAGELGREGTNRESVASSKQMLWCGNSQGCATGDAEKPSSRGKETWLFITYS